MIIDIVVSSLLVVLFVLLVVRLRGKLHFRWSKDRRAHGRWMKQPASVGSEAEYDYDAPVREGMTAAQASHMRARAGRTARQGHAKSPEQSRDAYGPRNEADGFVRNDALSVNDGEVAASTDTRTQPGDLPVDRRPTSDVGPISNSGSLQAVELPRVPTFEGVDGLILLDIQDLGPAKVQVVLSPRALPGAPAAVTAMEMLSPNGYVRSEDNVVLFATALNREIAPGETITQITVREC